MAVLPMMLLMMIMLMTMIISGDYIYNSVVKQESRRL
jgi:hypothetical protein